MPDKLICLARWKNYAGPNPKSNPEERARRFAMAFLSRGLQRHVVQVTYHLTKRLVGYRKGYYSDVEEKIIEICSYHKPKSLAGLLSLILGRQERGIFKRLSFLTNGESEINFNSRRIVENGNWYLFGIPLAELLLQPSVM